MSTLSRVAERVYWMGRYLERAEDTARVVAAYHHLIMDIPRGSQPGWDILFRIFDAEPAFYERFRVASEQNVIRFLVAECDEGASIPHAIHAARENARTTRDVLPEEVWELVNELHLYLREYADKSVGRRNRQACLQEVIDRCQLINGVLRSTLWRDHVYRFIKIGQLLERADMTTRIVDVGAEDILDREGSGLALEHLLWGTLLKSLSALGAYRRQIGPLVEQHATVDFVFNEADFPRSVRFCLRGIRQELTPLQHHERVQRELERARRKLRRFHAESHDRARLHAFIEDLQVCLSRMHAAIDGTWFRSGGG